jgi:Mce-associated membrane protein
VATGPRDRYADVLAAATAQTEAFVNIRYDRAEESIEAVAEGATGDFAEQYDASTEGVLTLLEENRSVMEGEVVWIGVVDADADSATVLAATTGTVANVTTDDEPVARAFRLRLEMVLVDGRWLTSDLQFVA